MADGVKIGSGTVDIAADMSNFDNAMAALPKKAATKMSEAMSALESRMARTKLDLKVALNKGDTEAIRQLSQEQDRLQAKIDAVTRAATSQATAIQAVAKASMQAADAAKAQAQAADEATQAAARQLAAQKAQLAASQAAAQAVAYAPMQVAQHQANVNASLLPVGPRDPKQQAVFEDLGDDADKAIEKLVKLGHIGGRVGQQVQAGGASGAMGLMMLSQAIDDAQYGFRAIVNNVPMLTSSIASGFGMSSEAAYKLGGAVGIAAVAVNTWVSHWEDVKSIFAGDWTHGASRVIRDITDALLTGAASLANFDRGLGAIGLTTAELARNQKGLADRAAQKAATEKAVADADSAVGGVGDAAAEARGALFREQLAKYGGGDKLRQEMLAPLEGEAVANARARAKANPKLIAQDEIDAAKKRVRESVDLEIEAAMRGNPEAMNRIARGRPGLPNAVDLQQQTIEAEGAENARAFRRQQLRETEALNRQGLENEHAAGEQRAAQRTQEARRLAGAMQHTVGRQLLSSPGMSDADLEARVKKSMEKAGVAADVIGDTLKETAETLRRDMKEKVTARAMERGISEETAQAQLIKEEKERERDLLKRENKGAGVVGDAEFYRSILAPGSGVPRDEIPKEQLVVQKEMVREIKGVAKILGRQKGDVARAAPKGAK